MMTPMSIHSGGQAKNSVEFEPYGSEVAILEASGVYISNFSDLDVPAHYPLFLIVYPSHLYHSVGQDVIKNGAKLLSSNLLFWCDEVIKAQICTFHFFDQQCTCTQ